MQASRQARPSGTGGTPHAVGRCPIGRASAILGDRWTLLIVREANLGVSRFDGFRARLGIADNILSSRLRALVEHGILAKTPYHDGRRQRSEYRLTQAGADLAPLLRSLALWGHEHTVATEPQDPLRVVHLDCGGEVDLDQRCGTCGDAVARDEQGWIRPWHSTEPTQLAVPINPAD
jgi:DNA-binding HxlR family transcriptional regulator